MDRHTGTPLIAMLVIALALAAMPARAAAARPADFYGVSTDDAGLSASARRAALARQAATGIGVIRELVHWNEVERSPGVYDPASLDAMVVDAAARGLRILPVLAFPPAFHSSRPAGSTATIQYPPSDPRAMARFAGWLVKRYGRGGTFWCPGSSLLGLLFPLCGSPYLPITAWQVWNEPDWPSWWAGAPDPVGYAHLLRAVALAIRTADPLAEVVLAGLTRRAAAPGGFLDRLYDQGAAPFFDTLAVHPYGPKVADVVSHVRDTLAVARRRGDHAPIRVTEYGWATGGGRTNLAVEPACQAALLYAATRRLTDLRAELSLQSIVQFMWNDRPPTRDIWPFHAGLVGIDGAAKPALDAFAAAVAGRPPPAGLTLAAACPPDRQDLG
jgi:polysaccharide biosynthesis protein PslG